MCWAKRVAWLLLWLGTIANPSVAKPQAAEIAEPQATDAVLLDFYADWCGPCQSMAPTVGSLVRDGYAVRRINIDQQPGLARQYDVRAVPCFVVVQEGREIDRMTGMTTIERLKIKLRSKSEIRNPKSEIGQPHPAWRYEQAVGYRAAVVRISCQDGTAGRSIGSGTLVRWGDRIVVLTARHVVKGASKIVVELCTGRTHRAKVVKVDAIWDCAVLELIGTPSGVQPATVELGSDAMLREGDRLESCGYGPDGKLACNSGLFLGYRRSSDAPRGPDDWLVISGHARGGDSGGPVFNRRGRLVGVLWGTDGKEVVCVQAGRIHVLLDEAVAGYRQKAILERNPTTPRLGPLVPVPPPCAPGCDCASEQTGVTKKPVLPWRGGAGGRDQAQAEQLDKLIELERRRTARESQPPEVPQVAPAPEVKPPAEEPSPVLAGLCIFVGIAVGFVVYFATQKN